MGKIKTIVLITEGQKPPRKNTGAQNQHGQLKAGRAFTAANQLQAYRMSLADSALAFMSALMGGFWSDKASSKA